MTCSSARRPCAGGNLFRLPIHNNRREIDPDDKRLRDGVADNIRKYDMTESESLLFGSNFGVTPDVKEGPNGSLYVASSSLGTIFEIRRKKRGHVRGRASRNASSPCDASR